MKNKLWIWLKRGWNVMYLCTFLTSLIMQDWRVSFWLAMIWLAGYMISDIYININQKSNYNEKL